MLYDPNLRLFVDDREIHQYSNLLRVVNRPKRLPEPVVAPDRPWERGCRAWAWGSVVQEPDGLLRMWYMAFNVWQDAETADNGGWCYAESRDGIHWEKPSLGLVEWRGSRDNNFFFTFDPDGGNLNPRAGLGLAVRDAHGNETGVVNSMDGCTVIRDDDDPDPSRRYKLIANMQDHRMWAPYFPEQYPDVTQEQIDNAYRIHGQYMLTSADGLHWSREPILLKGGPHGDYMLAARDRRNKQWWINERPWSLYPDGYRRSVGLSTSRDLINWTNPVEMIFSNSPESGFGKLWEWHGGIMPFNYGNQDLGLLEKWANVGYGDVCELVSHRDSEPWQRVAPGQALLDVGPEGSFDRALVYPLHNPPARVGDKLHIFYTGRGFEPGTGRYNYGAIGVATIGLDRFVALAHHRGEPGAVITKPVEVVGDALQVNVEPFGGEVRVGLRRADWSEIDGFRLDDCVPVTSDGVRAYVHWKQAELGRLRGEHVILQFSVRAAALYSYRFGSKEELQ